jgi:chaperonin GroES
MPADRLSVGNVEVLALTDQGPVDYDPFPLLNQLFPNVSLEAWSPYQQRYPEVFGGPNIWRTHYGCYLLRSRGRIILVDTGAGSTATNPGMIAFFGLEDGRLMSELQSAGVRPEDIDIVFFTYLRPDHVGWNLSESGARVTFPRARYVINQKEATVANFVPLGERVIVKPIEQEQTTRGGIVLPDTAKEKPQEGEVVAVGPGRMSDDGQRISMELSKGDRVVYSKFAGTEYKDGDEEYLILRESDILAKIS